MLVRLKEHKVGISSVSYGINSLFTYKLQRFQVGIAKESVTTVSIIVNSSQQGVKPLPVWIMSVLTARM